MISSLVRASSVSLGLHNLAIFRTSRISLLPAFQTDDAICITVLRGNLLTILVDIPSNSGYVYSGISKTVNLLSNGLLSRSVLFEVANITVFAFTLFVFLTFVLVNSPLSIIVSRPSWSLIG